MSDRFIEHSNKTGYVEQSTSSRGQSTDSDPTPSSPNVPRAQTDDINRAIPSRDYPASPQRSVLQNEDQLNIGAGLDGASNELDPRTPTTPARETLVATINNISGSYLEETLRKNPDYEPAHEAHGEDRFIRAMLIVKRGSTDLNTSVVRYAKIDTGSPVSLVPEETLEELGIVPYRFGGSHALTGLVQSAIVEPIGLEPIFWFDANDTDENPRIFQTTFKVLPKGTNSTFDFLLGADWLRQAQLQLAYEAGDGHHTRTPSSVLYLRILNQMQ